MKLIHFNPDNKLHQDLLLEFIENCISPISDTPPIVKYHDDIGDLDDIFNYIETIEFDQDLFDQEDLLEDRTQIAISNPNHLNFGIIVSLQYLYYPLDKEITSIYLKASGELLVNEKEECLVLDLEPSSLITSSQKEFKKARNSFRFKDFSSSLNIRE